MTPKDRIEVGPEGTKFHPGRVTPPEFAVRQRLGVLIRLRNAATVGVFVLFLAGLTGIVLGAWDLLSHLTAAVSTAVEHVLHLGLPTTEFIVWTLTIAIIGSIMGFALPPYKPNYERDRGIRDDERFMGK